VSQADKDRYRAAMHKMQTGVALKMQHDPDETSQKHLRVGVNGAMADQGGLVTLLIEKGIFTVDEYEKVIADFAEREAKMYQDWVDAHFGTHGSTTITLG